MDFCLDFGPFFFFSCSLAMCCSFIYLFTFASETELHVTHLVLFLYLFTFALETELHITHLPRIEGISEAFFIAHDSVFFVSYYPSLSPSLHFTGLLPLIVLPYSSLSWLAFLQNYFGINTIGCCKLSVLHEFQNFQPILKCLDPNKKNYFQSRPSVQNEVAK